MTQASPAPRVPLCAVCWHDPVTGRQGTNATTRLCSTCRADPLNADWSERWDALDLVGDIDRATARTRVHAMYATDDDRSLADMDGRPWKPPTTREKQILLLALHGDAVPVTRHDGRGRYRGTGLRRRDLSYREIAARAGCSHTFVRKVVERYWPTA